MKAHFFLSFDVINKNFKGTLAGSMADYDPETAVERLFLFCEDQLKEPRAHFVITSLTILPPKGQP